MLFWCLPWWPDVTIVQSDITIAVPWQVSTWTIHDYLYCYCPLVCILFEVLRIVYNAVQTFDQYYSLWKAMHNIFYLQWPLVVSRFDRLAMYHRSEFHSKMGPFFKHFTVLQGPVKHKKGVFLLKFLDISHKRVCLPTLTFCVLIPCIIWYFVSIFWCEFTLLTSFSIKGGTFRC